MPDIGMHPTAHPAIAEIHEQLAGLASDAATVARDRAREAAEASRWEQRAMDAVRRGDDGAARDALERRSVHADRASIAEHELVHLRAMEATCREFLATAGAIQVDDLPPRAPSNGGRS